MNGKMPLPWKHRGHLTLTDWWGNQIYLPTTAAVSLAFSVASIAKAIIYFNVIRVHIDEVSSGRQFLRSLGLVFEHLPFLATACLFRVGVAVLLLSYLNTYAFFAVAAFWFCCLAIGYRR